MNICENLCRFCLLRKDFVSKFDEVPTLNYYCYLYYFGLGKLYDWGQSILMYNNYNAMRNMNRISQQKLSVSSEFRRHFFGSQPNSDNFGLLTPTLCNTLADVFQANSQVFLGQVKTISMRDTMNNFVKKYYMQNYQMISSNKICEVELKVVQTIDIHLQHGNNSREKLLNVEKFGVF
ncbi:hypothetical protein PHYBLDRAFT_66870 [Phycomyces blakesleeanus NRRL 1555(-)]|uniref:Uncharacterized protein n=1 Tax=Phycomyces blakesleeanus (strain ATCC 8743b / DSM 1359 / FGSC 10004 / NBRC 33097 / NRRL 1555) TaxID=763407 RepID=A0A162TJV1_PHYB8|nr:hypothetical protein PHYBLDRAFT_66870 [Phycomyces blakesleeanus NRRL 1555(-)]OAD69162.1 hypothetical protein PHYBLDRAFT_66870 [Phycomyces blakesleeanus NRRL 1555(-)]|eukprot:XP_018287202.1 hypothetical protein PHYBLDRAFT_66870 [Phycomyces blakesleeanus NRRL 1555(-)]